MVSHRWGLGTFRLCAAHPGFTASWTLKGHTGSPREYRHRDFKGCCLLLSLCSLLWCKRIRMCAECQTSCCSAVNHSGCFKCSLRRSPIQALSAGSTFPLTPGLDKLGLDGCLWARHESRGRGATRRQHLRTQMHFFALAGAKVCFQLPLSTAAAAVNPSQWWNRLARK